MGDTRSYKKDRIPNGHVAATIAALCRLDSSVLVANFIAISEGLYLMTTLPLPGKTQFWKRVAAVTALLFSISLAASAASPDLLESKSSTSKIVNFSPATFVAKASAKFFYSIDNELKYSDQIDPHAPTLTRGPITEFLVSPDGSKIAVVIRKRLLIVGADSVLGEVAAVDSFDRRFKPLRRHFFRDEGFQWSRDSKSLYLIGDEYYHSRGSQLNSKLGELWRYDLDSRSLQLVLKPFAAFSYFFGPNSEIYYSESTGQGGFQLKLFKGRDSINVGAPDASGIPEISGGSDEGPFYSFSIDDYEKALPSLNVRLVDGNSVEDLIINGKKYLSVTQGYYWLEGYFYCPELLRSVFLPGNRFFLLNVPFCGNYKGQLLFDLESGQYQELPQNTVVFSTLNTMTFKRYRVTADGIKLK